MKNLKIVLLNEGVIKLKNEAGAEIQELISSRYHTQASFADKIGLKPQHMSNILKGNRACSQEVLSRITEPLGLKVSWQTTVTIVDPTESSTGQVVQDADAPLPVPESWSDQWGQLYRESRTDSNQSDQEHYEEP